MLKWIPARQRQVLHYFVLPKVPRWQVSTVTGKEPLDQRPYYLRVEDRIPEDHFNQFDGEGIPFRGTRERPLYNITTVCAYAFATWNLWHSTKQTEQRTAFQRAAGWLVKQQHADGGWYYQYDHNPLKAPWLSGMAQGEGVSVMARAYAITGEVAYQQVGKRALEILAREVTAGGVCRTFDYGMRFYEEAPTTPPSLILNGFLYALFGVYDWLSVDAVQAQPLWDAGYQTLVQFLPRYDTGYWSLYDLWPVKRAHLASFAYHDLHLAQLTVMQQIAPHPTIEASLRSLQQARANPLSRLRAVWGKMLYSLEP